MMRDCFLQKHKNEMFVSKFPYDASINDTFIGQISLPILSHPAYYSLLSLLFIDFQMRGLTEIWRKEIVTC